MQFRDQVVWITGASDGIGAALAKVMAREGARLILTARREDRLREVADQCAPAEVVVLPADLLELDGAEALAERALAAFGHIDVLVNNAGVSQRGTALDTELPVVRWIMDLNFMAPVALTRAVVPSMVARGSGTVVVTSSIAGRLGTPRRSAYAASKHAVEGWFESLRAELHGTGVGVLVLAPGYVNTGLSFRALNADGSAYGRRGAGDAHGITPEACAERLARGIRRGESDIMVGGKEVGAVYLKRWVPGLVRRFLHKAAPGDAEQA